MPKADVLTVLSSNPTEMQLCAQEYLNQL